MLDFVTCDVAERNSIRSKKDVGAKTSIHLTLVNLLGDSEENCFLEIVQNFGY